MAMPMTEYELEALPELEGEFEDEGEEFLGSIARGIGSLRGEQGEFEDEYEGEWEWEGEDEWEGESEEFFRQLADMARRGLRSQPMQRLGQMARRAAMVGRMAGLALNPLQMPALPQERPPIESAVQQPGRRGPMGQFPPQQEFEDEWELEAEVNPQQRAYSSALMEHLGHAAMQAESEAEAEAFIGALIPLAAQLVPRAAPAIMRSAPQLVRGLANVARTLRRTPATRPLVRTLPTVMRRTAATMARQQAQGQPVTPPRAVQTLARQTAQVISSPQQSVQAYQRSRTMDRQYHRAARTRQPAALGSQREW